MQVTNKLIRVLILIFLLLIGLYLSKPYVVPLMFGFLLSTLILPFAQRLEKMGVGRAAAALMATFLLLVVAAGTVALFVWQIADLTEDADPILSKITEIPTVVQEYIRRTLHIPISQQKVFIKKQGSSLAPEAGGSVIGAAGSLLSSLGSLLLVVIYTFLFIFYRRHLKTFVLRLVSTQKRDVAEHVMVAISRVAQKYIFGLGMMISMLWVMYGIGFSIIGIKHALFFAISCGLLEIVPYVGNLTGSSIAAVMAFSQGGVTMALWVLVVYITVQLIQSYLLEPLVVGAHVSINPFSTILAIIGGEMLWGVSGMVLAVPMLGILKIVCDNIPEYQAFGFLIGEVKQSKKRKLFGK